MGYPVNARYEARVAGTTTIKAAWADATDDSFIGLYGGTRTIYGVHVDGVGDVAKAAIARTIKAWGGALKLTADGANDVEVNPTAGQYFVVNGKIQTWNGQINQDQSAVTYSAGSGTYHRYTGDAGAKQIGFVMFGATQTTDAATAKDVITIGMSNNSLLGLAVTVVGVKSDWTLGYRHQTIDAYRKAGAGAITQTGGGTVDISAADATELAPFAHGWAVSGGNLIYRITGVAATTINWMVKAEVIQVA